MDKNDILDYVTETPGNTNRAVLGSMLDSVNSGSSLPSVTSDDNGKVLAVVEGVWDKAEASSGGGDGSTLKVMVSDSYLDKTWQEINNALIDGVLPIVYFNYPMTDGNSIYIINRVSIDLDTYYVYVVGSNDVFAYISDPNSYPYVVE